MNGARRGGALAHSFCSNPPPRPRLISSLAGKPSPGRSSGLPARGRSARGARREGSPRGTRLLRAGTEPWGFCQRPRGGIYGGSRVGGLRAMARHSERRKKGRKEGRKEGREGGKPRTARKNQAGAECSRGAGSCRGPAAPSLDQFHVVGGEHAEVAVGAVAPPPALVDHLDVGDDVLRVKRDLSVVSWRETEGR